MIYKVNFPDGQIKNYAANIISEKMVTPVDSDGFSLMMINAIINYQEDRSVAFPEADIYVVTRQEQNRARKKTIVCSLLVKWSD